MSIFTTYILIGKGADIKVPVPLGTHNCALVPFFIYITNGTEAKGN